MAIKFGDTPPAKADNASVAPLVKNTTLAITILSVIYEPSMCEYLVHIQIS